MNFMPYQLEEDNTQEAIIQKLEADKYEDTNQLVDQFRREVI